MIETVAGHRVHVTRSGEGPNRLFIHCSLGRSETLAGVARALPPARDVFFDLPGHGRSAPWEGTDFHGDVTEVARGLLDGPTHVLGHSFGATVALRLAGLYPELVSRLTLIEPVMFCAAQDAARDDYITLRQPFVDAWLSGDREAAAQAFLTMWGGRSGWDAMPGAARAQLAGLMGTVISAGAAIEQDGAGIMARLGRITCPVDLIEGADSQPVMASIMDALETLLPQAQRHVIAGAGHMVAVSHARQVAAVMDA